MGRYLGIDYGVKRVGLAAAEADVKMARPLRTVPPAQLVETIKQEGPFDVLVVGLPRSLDGNDTPQTLAVRRFADDHLADLAPDLVFQDEAGTSAIAEDRLIESGRKYQKEDIDAEAASIILQDYLDSL
jgi:putative Holliday junction resolvase